MQAPQNNFKPGEKRLLFCQHYVALAVGILICCASVNRLAGQTNILDFADEIVTDTEPNDPNQPQDLPFDPGGGVLAVGITGNLTDSDDTDTYRFDVTADQQLELRFKLDAGAEQAITAVTSGPNRQIYFAANGNIWRKQRTNPGEEEAEAELVALRTSVADVLSIPESSVVIQDIVAFEQDEDLVVLFTMAGRGDILRTDEQGQVTVALSQQALLDETGLASADLVGLEALKTPILLGNDLAEIGNPRVTLETNFGDIVLELYANAAPITVANFLDYVENGFYDGLIFHRTIDDFVIQAGAYDPNLYEDFDPNFFADSQWPRDPTFYHEPGPAIVSEASNQLRNDRGTIAMALSGTNANSATSQFFINLTDNNFLDFDDPSPPPFTVFGRVVEGMNTVVDVIGAGATVSVPSDPNFLQLEDVPANPVIIEHAVSQASTFSIVLADAVSGDVFLLDDNFVSLLPVSDGDEVQEAMRAELLDNDLRQNVTPLPRTVLARTEEAFVTNALVRIGEGELYPAGFYVSQLGPAFDGDGTVTRIDPNADNPDQAGFEPLFIPADSNQENLNPSSLAFDTTGAFGGKLFVGTFGADLGDEMDGSIFIVEPNGLLTDFVTSFVDDMDQPVIRDGEPVTGFFDVTDMAFSPGGAFGTYLYVVSENVDSNGSGAGGFGSDIWRIAPDGTAELFVENIADGVITLAFGPFDYGNDLYVGTFTTPAEVLRIEPDRTFETFYSFSVTNPSAAISDLVFADGTTLFGETMLLSLRSGNESRLIQLEANVGPFTDLPVWGRGITAGDVSSGDLLFDTEDNLYVLEQGSGQLTRLDYQGLFDFTIVDVQIRDITVEDDSDGSSRSVTPYLLLDIAEQPRIIRLGQIDPNVPGPDIATEVSPSTLYDPAQVEDDDNNVSFVFGETGDIFILVQDFGAIGRSPRNDAQQRFNQFTVPVNLSQIDSAASLQDTHILQLATADEGDLLAIAVNTSMVESGSLPDQITDDTIVLLEDNFFNTNLSPQTFLNIGDLTQMELTIAGGGIEQTFSMRLGETGSERIEDPNAGEYTLTVDSPGGLTGAYTILVALGGQLETSQTITAGNSPLQLTTIAGDTLVLSLNGPGQATLNYSQRPGAGLVVTTDALVLAATTGQTQVSLQNQTHPSRLELGELSLDGSLGQTYLRGEVASVTAADDSKGRIELADWGTVRNVDTPGYQYDRIVAQAMGDPNTSGGIFDAKGLSELLVIDDIHNMAFFDNTSLNRYDSIVVDGTIVNSGFFGRQLKLLEVNNLAGEENAVSSSSVLIAGTIGQINQVLIEQGSVANTAFITRKKIDRVDVQNGNLTGCTLNVSDSRGRLGRVWVRRISDDPNDFDAAGNIIDSQISAGRRVDFVYADGDISGTSRISSTAGFSSSVRTVSCGGDFSGTIASFRVNDVLIGYDLTGKRLTEDDDFTGGNFNGTLSATINLRELNVTGKIDGATVQTSLGDIFAIYAEDGLENSTLRAGRIARKILIGYLAGRRSHIINEQADVSGNNYFMDRLGRLYYTGALSPGDEADLDGIRHFGRAIDDVPGN